MTTARDDHDHWLEQDSGFARVLHGNAIEGHTRRRRRPRPSRALRLLRALLDWLTSPSPWSQRPMNSTAPRIPRIPARVHHLRPDPRPRWHESPALRVGAILCIGIVGAFGVYCFRQVLGWLA